MVSAPAMSRLSRRIEIDAPAKINLFLDVLGRRAGGYHDLRSVVVPVAVCDRVTLAAAEAGIEVTVEGPFAGTAAEPLIQPHENLAARAARALKDVSGHPGGVRIRLEKNIPVGGGLGGGSADAAAVLAGLNRLWGLEMSAADLVAIAPRLGCDVPSLLHGGAVLMEGLGETVSGIGADPGAGERRWWVVLVNPGFRVSTKDVYERYCETLTSGGADVNDMVLALRGGDMARAVRSLYNRLQPTVFRKFPILQIMAEALEEAGAAGVLLAGSGASLFGMAWDEGHANQVAARAAASLGFPLWCKVTRTLPDGVMAAHGPLEA